MEKYFIKIIGELSKSLKSIDANDFEKLVFDCKESIINGGKIVASGLGKNVPICDKFIGTLNSLGISAAFMHTNTAMHGDLGLIKDKDTVIILTKSGNTAESIILNDQLSKRKTNTWLISFNKNSILSKEINKSLLLDLEHEGDMWDILPNNSTTLFLILLQGIAMNLVKELGITLEDFKKNHPGGDIGVKLGGKI